MKKSKRIIDCYRIRKQLHGKFKVTEYSHTDNSAKKRTIAKDLLLSDAEDLIYRLENKLK